MLWRAHVNAEADAGADDRVRGGARGRPAGREGELGQQRAQRAACPLPMPVGQNRLPAPCDRHLEDGGGDFRFRPDGGYLRAVPAQLIAFIQPDDADAPRA